MSIQVDATRLVLARQIRAIAAQLEELSPELDGARDGTAQREVFRLAREIYALGDTILDRPRRLGPVESDHSDVSPDVRL